MYYYRIYGKTVVSDIRIPEAYESDVLENVQITIAEEPGGSQAMKQLSAEEEKMIERFGGFRLYTDDGKGYLWIDGTGFFIMREGKEIRYTLFEGADDAYVRQVILVHCLNILLMQSSQISIHGSGLDINGSGLIISGRSGAGKTTLSTELLAMGLGFVADDVNTTRCVEGHTFIEPAYPQRKLCGDTLIDFGYSLGEYEEIPNPEKKKYSFMVEDNIITEAIKLDTIVIIEPGNVNEVEIKQIHGSRKVKYVVENLFAKEEYDKVGFGSKEMISCIRIANDVDVFVLQRPAKGNSVREQIQMLKKCGIITEQK